MPLASANNPPNIQNGLVGNLKVNNLDSGQGASNLTFWRGDGHWGPLGYTQGAGGAVTQLTSITTAVTLNNASGQITTVSNAFTSGTLVSFTVNNNLVAATDVPIVAVKGAVGGGAICAVSNVGTGSFVIVIDPTATATFSVIINFCIIKGASS